MTGRAIGKRQHAKPGAGATVFHHQAAGMKLGVVRVRANDEQTERCGRHAVDMFLRGRPKRRGVPAGS